MRRDYRWIEAAISHITAQLSATGAGPQADTLQAALNLAWTPAAKIRFLHGKHFQMKLGEAARVLINAACVVDRKPAGEPRNGRDNHRASNCESLTERAYNRTDFLE